MRIILAAMLMAVLLGCNFEQAQQAEEKEESQFFTTTNGLVEFEFPGGWHKNRKKHPFDLQCFSRNQRMTTGVFVYPPKDLTEDSSPEKMFKFHIDDMREKRKNFSILEQEQTKTLDGKRLTTVVYSGEKDSGKYYYRFTLIQFNEEPRQANVVLQVALPSLWPDQEPVLAAITESARLRATNPIKPTVDAK